MVLANYNIFICTYNTPATLKDRSDDEMKWYLHLLASVVKRTGPALVPQLRTVITECFASNKKALAKAAGKLLRNVLYTLSQYYPTDFRSAPPAVWNSEGALPLTASLTRNSAPAHCGLQNSTERIGRPGASRETLAFP
jgi:hypothetical protein